MVQRMASNTIEESMSEGKFHFFFFIIKRVC